VPVKVFAHDESRVGLLPIVQRRITACGVQPIATVTPTFDSFYLYGAVEPTTGASFFLELPHLHTALCQVWVDGFAAAFPEAFTIVVLDNGACHKAKTLRWPANTGPIFLPPSSPELHPIERLGRDLKDKLADFLATTLDELSDTVCALMQNYSNATLQSLTGFPYFVQAVATVQKALYV
jgi:hypothetical protein